MHTGKVGKFIFILALSFAFVSYAKTNWSFSKTDLSITSLLLSEGISRVDSRSFEFEGAQVSTLEQMLIERARAEVALAVSVPASDLSLASIEKVEWSDASLGCPQPGMMYAQVVTQGYLIKLQDLGGNIYPVHSGNSPESSVILCRQEVLSLPPELLGSLWYWQIEGSPNANYTIEFLAEGTIGFQADCNRGRAHFEVMGQNQLLIDLPVMTRAACPPGSQEAAFVEQLMSSSSYAFEGSTLVLYPKVYPGIMRFSKVTTVNPAPVELVSQIQGQLIYRERIALPAGSQISVYLYDVSRADAPAIIVSSWSQTTTGENVPIPFALNYDSNHIEVTHNYIIQAEIRDSSGLLKWRSAQAYPVLTYGAPASDLTIMLTQAN